MAESKVFMFPNANDFGGRNSIDPALFALLSQNGGFGGNNAIWLIFLWMIWMNGGWGNGFGGGFGNNGAGFLSNQINNDAGRDLLLQAINGRADALSQLANILNTNVSAVQSAVNGVQSAIQTVGSQVGMSALQTQNAIQAGNASLSQQLASCCCENRLAICQQTNALQSQAASNFAAQQLQDSQNHAEDRLDVCQQTNELKSQSILNTQSLKDAIAAQSIMINDKFCDLEKRELQSKINTQGDIITQLRGQIDNDRQTAQFYNLIAPLQAKVNEIAAKQPNTVPVQYPNLVAINQTPNGYPGGYPYGYGYGCPNSFWN